MSEIIRTPSPFRRRSDRRSILRALPLNPIGDIANPALSESTVSPVRWETQSDWDNAVSESYADHPSGVVSMAPGNDSFEDLADGNAVPAAWNPVSAAIDSGRGGSEGSLSVDNNDGPSGGTAKEDYAFASTVPGGVAPATITFAYYETSSSGGIGFEVWDSADSNIILRVGSANPEVGYNDTGDIISSPSPEYGEWRRFTITFDWANDQYDILWEDVTGSTSDQTVSGAPFMNSASGIGASYIGAAGNVSWSGAGNAGANGNEWIDEAYGVYYQSSITTATKSFSVNTKPNLSNLSYTLNGETIVLDVIGSPGTASEEIVTQTLDGSTGYSLTWSNSHTDFRIKASLESASRDTSPSVDVLELSPP